MGETDLDLGHYERFTDVNLTATSEVLQVVKFIIEVIDRKERC